MVSVWFGVQPTDWDDSRREIFPWPTVVETRRSKKKFGGEERQYCADYDIILVPGQGSAADTIDKVPPMQVSLPSAHVPLGNLRLQHPGSYLPGTCEHGRPAYLL